MSAEKIDWRFILLTGIRRGAPLAGTRSLLIKGLADPQKRDVHCQVISPKKYAKNRLWKSYAVFFENCARKTKRKIASEGVLWTQPSL